MALISMRQLLDYAAENDFGMPAFNVNNMEQVHAIMQNATGKSAVIDAARLVALSPTSKFTRLAKSNLCCRKQRKFSNES